MTIITTLRTVDEPGCRNPCVLGVDDWAMRRGQRYGTILVGLERPSVIDLLPNRETATLATWLGAHPGVEIVYRNRGQSYAKGARVRRARHYPRCGSVPPVHNLVDSLEQACGRHHHALRTAACGEPTAGTTSDVGESAAAPWQRRRCGLPCNRPRPTAAKPGAARVVQRAAP
jgi:hypothetical protein